MKTIIIIVCVAMVGLVAFGFTSKIMDGEIIDQAATSSMNANMVTLTISGEVVRPGSYVLKEGSTLNDLVLAASGLTGNADLLAFNLDYVLKDKEYYIAPVYDNSNTCSDKPIEKTNINLDDASTMQKIAGFSKTVSEAIVAYRSANPFKAIEEIKDVTGIGPATYTSARNKITIRSSGV